jgi:hypothetical protein
LPCPVSGYLVTTSYHQYLQVITFVAICSENSHYTVNNAAGKGMKVCFNDNTILFSIGKEFGLVLEHSLFQWWTGFGSVLEHSWVQ